MRKRKKKLVVALLLCFVALILLKQVLNVAVRIGLERGFAAGTDCIVIVEDATFHFFPLGASLKNGLIRHPNEPESHGFRVREGSIKLINLWKLITEKRIRLTDLELNGVSAKSFGDTTGFINTIDFLASGDSAPSTQRKAQWHDFISRGWKVKLVNMVIHANEGADPQLVIHSGVFTYSWNNILFTLTNTDPPEEPTVLSGTAQTFAIQFKDEPPITHGRTTAVVDSLKGVLQAREATLMLDTPSGPSSASVTGAMYIHEQNAYRLNAKASISRDHLRSMLQPYSTELANLGAQGTLDVNISGALLDPQFEGETSIEIPVPNATVLRPSCIPKNATSHFQINARGLSLTNTQIESMLEDARFELDFSAGLPFSLGSRVTLSPVNTFLKQCLEPPVEVRAEGWVNSTLEHWIADSVSDVQVTGTFLPFSSQGTLRSDIALSQAGIRSQLESSVTYDRNLLNLTVNERGSNPRIKGASPDGDAHSTDFERSENAALSVSLSYNFADGKLEIPRFSLRDYPLAQLLVRTAPFLSESVFAFVTKTTSPGSTIAGSLEIRQPPNGRPTGAGSFTISAVTPFGLPVSTITIPVKIESDTVTVNPATVSSVAGDISAEISWSLSGTGSASLSAPLLNLNEIPAVRNSLQLQSANAQAEFRLKRTPEKITYEGDARITSTLGRSTDSVSSDLHLSGDDLTLALKANVLGPHARIDVAYPLRSESESPMKVTGAVQEFPLEILAPLNTPQISGRQSSPEFSGSISGTIEYLGPRAHPLQGSGRIDISDLSIDSDGVLIAPARPIRVDVTNGRLNFTDVIIRSGEKQAQLSGWVSEADGWNAAISGAWNLHSIAPRLSQVEQISGTLEAALSVRGTMTDPELSGTLTVADGEISFPLGQTIVGANKINITSSLSDNFVDIKQITGNIGDGRVLGRGEVSQLFDGQNRAFALNLNLLGIELEPIERFTTRADGLLSLRKVPNQSLSLSGDINISNAYYEDKISLRNILASLTRTITGVRSIETSGSSSAGGGDVDLDLNVIADNSVILETNIAQAELRANIHAGGSIREPRIGGTIETIEGSFGVQSRKFDIISGKLTFPDQAGNIDPEVDIVGETILMGSSRDTYQVLIDIGGTLTHPVVSFSSDSGLAQRDIVSLLFFGGQIEELSLLNYSTESSRISYGEILNPSSDLTFTERLAALASFSDISIDTVSPLSSTELVPVVSATRPILEGVDLILRSELSSNQRSSASISYSLTPYLSTVATWSNRSVTNARSGSSTVGLGLRYRRTFPGLMIFPSVEAFE